MSKYIYIYFCRVLCKQVNFIQAYESIYLTYSLFYGQCEKEAVANPKIGILYNNTF